jgi:predicted nucleotidyltransferase
MFIYLEAGNHDRIFDQQTHLFEDEGDYELAGARLLGRDLRLIAKPDTINIILGILESEKDFDSLTSDIFRSDAINIDYDSKYLKITSLLNSLLRGIKN